MKLIGWFSTLLELVEEKTEISIFVCSVVSINHQHKQNHQYKQSLSQVHQSEKTSGTKPHFHKK